MMRTPAAARHAQVANKNSAIQPIATIWATRRDRHEALLIAMRAALAAHLPRHQEAINDASATAADLPKPI